MRRREIIITTIMIIIIIIIKVFYAVPREWIGGFPLQTTNITKARLWRRASKRMGSMSHYTLVGTCGSKPWESLSLPLC